MILSKYKLSTLITLLLLSLLLPFGCVVIIFSYINASDQLVDNFEKRFHENLSIIAMDVARHGRNGDLHDADRLISMAAANDNLEHLSLIDAQGKIRFSTRYEWVEADATSVLEEFSLHDFKSVLGTDTTLFTRDNEFHDIEGYYPVDFMLSNLSGEHKEFVLYGEYSHRVESGQLFAHELKSLSYFIVGLLFMAVLIVFIINHWLRKPLDKISEFIHHIEQGEDTKKSLEVNSTKDVAHVAKALSAMNLELHRSQDELKEAAVLIRNVINSVPDLIFFKDLQGEYLGCNQSFCDFIGELSVDKVVGKNDYNYFDKELADFFREKDKAMLESFESKQNEEWVTYPDGHKVLLSTLKTPYYDDDGSVIGLIGISRDITVAKKMEEELYQSQKMESLGTLVGGIAHDFNNTLAGITGNTYLAKMKVEKKDYLSVPNHLARIDKLSKHAAGIVSQLLVFARKGIVKKKNVSLSELVKNSLDMTSIVIPNSINFTTNIGSEKLMINADSTQIQQVLINLMDNAKDAVAKSDAPHITLSLESFVPTDEFLEQHPDANSASYAKLTIEDNGYGINQENLNNVYEPFFTTKPMNEGTGLGLSMVLGAVQTHSALIEIESEPKLGTSIQVYFPLIEIVADTQEITAMPSIVATEKGLVILLADDEEGFRSATSEIIETFGHTVLRASDGKEALSLFKANRDKINIAILDVVMPHCGGEVLASNMRELKPTLPVIFVTGYDASQVLGDMILDNSAVFMKPAPIEKLMQKIEDFRLEQENH
ncbi:MAG: ATP-binding protein [Ghiorsea sp.]